MARQCWARPGGARLGKVWLGQPRLGAVRRGVETRRAIPRNQSYVGWAKASGTADRFMRAAFAHAVGARALVGLRWAKSRGASRRHIGRARRFCPPYDERDLIGISETLEVVVTRREITTIFTIRQISEQTASGIRSSPGVTERTRFRPIIPISSSTWRPGDL